MARSLPLAAYLALRGSEDHGSTAPTYPPRPKGAVVWAVCPDAEMAAKAAILGDVLRAEGDQIAVVSTLPTAIDDGPATPRGRKDIQRFLSHWSPQLVVWMGAKLDPLLINEIAIAGVPIIILEASKNTIAAADRHWIPGLTRAVLAKVDTIVCVDGRAQAALVQAGAASADVLLIGRIEETPPLLPYNENERRDFAETLGTRPVWLAADTGPDEVETLVTAHTQASRRAHRLLMVVACRAASDCAGVAAALRDRHFDVIEHATGDALTDATQIYVVEGGEELGLWYRLAPMTYLAGTLADGPCRHPFEAAALGSAVLHGPNVSPYAAQIARLAGVNGCLAVRSATDLGDAVEALLSADKAAQLAHAAWDITTQGADVANQVADLIHQRLDESGG